MLKILLSNDDGVLAPGLLLLRETLKQMAHVTVIAPETDSSGGGSSISLSSVIRVTELEKDYYSMRGTPADCVHAALTGFLSFTPDIVISGINYRSNLGDDIIYSGTFGAAYEGRKLKFPSIAMSMVSRSATPKYETAAKVCVQLIESMQNKAYFSQGVLNVNVPDVEYVHLKGIKLTRLGQRPYSEPIIRQKDPRGNDFFWLGLRKEPENLDDPHTDFHAIANHFVSVSPVNLNLSDENLLSELTEIF